MTSGHWQGFILAGAIAALACGAAVAQNQAAAPTPPGGVTLAPHPLTEYQPVTDAVLRNPDPSDWIMMRLGVQRP